MPKPYRIKAAAESREAELLIYGDIGESWWGESVTAKATAEELAALDVDRITVRINSYGGSVSDGLAIYNSLRNHRAEINVRIDGVAVSIASLIAMAGDSVEMAENALFMVHAPWGGAVGNAKDLREYAEVLDTFAEAMTSSYMRKTGQSRDEILALLTDGADHWYTAAEAEEFGFVDTVIEEQMAAAAGFAHSSWALAAFNKRKGVAERMPTQVTLPSAPAVAKTTQPQEAAMPIEKKREDQATDDQAAIEEAKAKATKAAMAAERKRKADIRASFAPFLKREGVQDLLDECIDDDEISAPQASEKLLAKLGEGAEPLARGPVEIVEDSRDKLRAGVSNAILARMRVVPSDAANEYRGQRLPQLAASILAASGVNVRGLTASEIAGKVLAAHSSSDFPYLLADAANKALQQAYGNFPSTWSQIAAAGEVTDFKTINLVRMGSFNSLATINEGGEYTQGTIGEEREQLTAATKGKYIQLTRQMIINDDLSGFSRMAQMLGRAAARTVNADVYGVINANAAMADGTVIFHADHANLAGTGAAISVATLGAGRSAMRKQTSPGSNATEYLNIMPRTLLVPVVLEDLARVVVNSENDTDTAGSRKRNPIRDWGPMEVVSDPTLDASSTTAWYLVADPMDVPLLEVRFLDGQQTPYVASEEEFLTDAIRWKVRLDYGVAANDFRGGYKNAGA